MTSLRAERPPDLVAAIDPDLDCFRLTILGIGPAFPMVVLASLRARLEGWVPSGPLTLGRVTQNRLPPSGEVSIHTVPSTRSTICWTMASPIPRAGASGRENLSALMIRCCGTADTDAWSHQTSGRSSSSAVSFTRSVTSCTLVASRRHLAVGVAQG